MILWPGAKQKHAVWKCGTLLLLWHIACSHGMTIITKSQLQCCLLCVQRGKNDQTHTKSHIKKNTIPVSYRWKRFVEMLMFWGLCITFVLNDVHLYSLQNHTVRSTNNSFLFKAKLSAISEGYSRRLLLHERKQDIGFVLCKCHRFIHLQSNASSGKIRSQTYFTLLGI